MRDSEMGLDVGALEPDGSEALVGVERKLVDSMSRAGLTGAPVREQRTGAEWSGELGRAESRRPNTPKLSCPPLPGRPGYSSERTNPPSIWMVVPVM